VVKRRGGRAPERFLWVAFVTRLTVWRNGTGYGCEQMTFFRKWLLYKKSFRICDE
jgi:hypothetical protein